MVELLYFYVRFFFRQHISYEVNAVDVKYHHLHVGPDVHIAR